MDRRSFFERLLGGSALSLLAMAELNASIYDNIKSLNEAFKGVPSPDGTYWEGLKKHYLFENELIMMNNGTVGPIPQPVFNTMVDYLKVQLTAPCNCYLYLPTKVDDVRVRLAEFIGASPDEVVITRNTTEGMNFVANGLDMKPGDEVLMSDLEHPGGIHPWRLKAKRYGIAIKEVPFGVPPGGVDQVVETFKKAITPRTKVISISHTVYKTGLVAPLKELSELAHQHGILIVADSAHGVGMLDLDLHETGVDFWTSSPYKWLGAPPGVGVLYVKQDVQDRLWPTIASSGWDTYKTARRFETLSQRNDALALAMGEAIEFQKLVGKGRIARRIHTLASHLKDQLREIPGVRLHTNDDGYLSAGLTAFSLKGVKPEDLVNYVRERYNIVIRTIGDDKTGTTGVRVSTHIFVSLKDVDLLVQGIKECVSTT